MQILPGIVRPEIFPDIRPKVSITAFPAQEPEKDPNAGRTILSGNDGQVIDLNKNVSASMSRNQGREEKRKYDIARVYQAVENKNTGAVTVNKSNYVDVEMPTKIRFRRGEKGPTRLDVYRTPKQEDYKNKNVEIRETDLVRENPRE